LTETLTGTSAETSTETGAMKARVHVTLKPGVLDPQGKAIAGALASLGFAGVGEVRQGKVIDLEIDGSDRGEARSRVEAMCQQLLANTVIEDYAIELEA
jgi:phosphoribosylformylglycinamidine synthase PurS subunit